MATQGLLSPWWPTIRQLGMLYILLQMYLTVKLTMFEDVRQKPITQHVRFMLNSPSGLHLHQVSAKLCKCKEVADSNQLAAIGITRDNLDDQQHPRFYQNTIFIYG